MKWCVSCFKQYDDEYDICPFCKAEEVTEPKVPVHIKPGTELYHGRYVIGLAIGDSGFCIVYRAWDKYFRRIVAIKEFYMFGIMLRTEGDTAVSVYKRRADEYRYRKEQFLAEARILETFGGGSGFQKVYDCFEDNGTAYIVMELLTGRSLKSYLKEQDGGKVDPQFAVAIVTEAAKALKIMHNHRIVHRSIAPDSIFYTEKRDGGRAVYIIGLETALSFGDHDVGLWININNGYSPVESYDLMQKHIGPWTDVYSLGAVLYNMLTGITPEEATLRKATLEWGEKDPLRPPYESDPSVPVALSNAVMHAMAIDAPARFKDMDEFIKAIDGKKTVHDSKEKRKFSILNRIGFTRCR